MDASLRNAKGLHDELGALQANLLRRFTNLVNLAEVKHDTRGVSAVTQYQIQAETAALIRAAEDVQTIIRQMQEMWLFGQLNTLGESRAQRETDENARDVAGLLKRLTEAKFGAGEVETNGTNGTNGGHHDAWW